MTMPDPSKPSSRRLVSSLRQMAASSANGAVFCGNVHYRNEVLFARGLYPPIEVPPGITPRQPFFASMADMIGLATQRRRKYEYNVDLSDSLSHFPAGYTHSDLAVRFLDFDRQWQRAGSSWRYQGGRICLDVTIGVYADERSRERPRCLSLILQHELLHVADEVEIAMEYLPWTAAQAPFIRSHFQVPIPDREFEARVRGSGGGEGSEFERLIQRSLWIPESSRRASQAHSDNPDDGRVIANCLKGG
ncbi:MAG: hypothetical protein ACREVE_07145 [Gammaproteobacteria bacterium]